MTARTEAAPGIAARLRDNARTFPDKKAIIFPAGRDRAGATVYRHVTYREVDDTADAYARRLLRAGIDRGTKTIVMVRPGPDLFAIVFALFRIGAVPVIADPGLGLRRMLHCYRTAGAEAFVGIPEAHVLRVLSPRTFSSLRTSVTVGRRWFWGGPTLREPARPPAAAPGAEGATGRVEEPALSDDDLLAISFTTGSTGPAKGVEHPRGMVEGIVRQIRDALGQREDDVSLVTVPLWGIFSLLLGSTCVLPPGDPAKVAAIDPRAVVEAIERFGVTTMFASPALLDRLGRYATGAGIGLGSLRGVVSGGAPVRDDIAATICDLLGEGGPARFRITYGATEALPISSITAEESLAETRALIRTGSGTCVGRPVPDVEARIVPITDTPIPEWSDDLPVELGQVGEIAVSGPTVSGRYHAAPEADGYAKIPDGERVWHRTGDLGRIDEAGRIWFCGRKSQRVHTAGGTLYTVPCEGILNAHPDVHRTALVGVGPPERARPVVCVELHDGVPTKERARVERELRELAARHEPTRPVEAFLFHPGFPVDIRHNAKINREELAEWAGARLAAGAGPRRRLRAWVPRLVPLAGWAFLLYGLLWPFTHRCCRPSSGSTSCSASSCTGSRSP
ncbi:fatty acid CoA ligase family protein [Allosalinactinospora lopnorensis]|uniref:fatty acid CoA ligase family protein n=1 Tax=Allosalinactinospora lopnorensis TaxID=1352348 RepID=UPI000B1CD36D|nr:fatty acid CoA ligase family protein [Allosalinactinospora lopnorensis]